MTTKVLSDGQLEAFDQEYIGPDEWAWLKPCIDRDFPSGNFSLLDVGGGNGVFADRILGEYPQSTVTVLDLSQMLLSRNKPNSRKRTVLGSATELEKVTGRFDIVSVNWVFHHLVGDTYSESRANVIAALRECARLGTRISVWENMYDGHWFDGLPGWLIYRLTSLKSLAKVTRFAGANTAGVGVCFQSCRQWKKTFADAGLEVVSAERDVPFLASRRLLRAALHLKPVSLAHFWLKAATS